MRTVVAEDDVTRPIVPVKITNALTGRSTVVFGMIDSGADRDVLSLNIVKRLDLPTEKMLMRVHTVNCEVVEEKTLASFILSSLDETYNVHISDSLTGNLLTLLINLTFATFHSRRLKDQSKSSSALPITMRRCQRKQGEARQGL